VSHRARLATLLILLCISTPYLFAARLAGREAVFGGFLLNPQDGNSYLAKMYQGWRGDASFTLPYTAEPGPGAHLFLFYLWLGRLARWTGASLIFAFHLARLIGSVALLFSLQHFVIAYAPNTGWSDWCFALAGFGLGLGWLLFPLGIIVSDLWIAEAYPFLSAYVNPHFAVGLALLLSLLTFGESKSGGLAVSFVLSIAAGFALSLLSPFGVILACLVMFGMLIWELALFLWTQRGPVFSSLPHFFTPAYKAFPQPRWILIRLIGVFLGGAPFLIYSFWVARLHPQLAAWNAQNLTLTPAAWDVALGLSPALLLAIPGAVWIIRQRHRRGMLPLIWIVIGALLIYLPMGLQRRFMMGIYAPMVVLAAYGLQSLPLFLKQRAPLAARLTFLLALPTSALILAMGVFGALARDPLLYLSASESEAMRWIETHTPQDALVLCAPDTGMFIPARTGRRVLYGHPFETVNAEQEKEQVLQFFQGGMASPQSFLIARPVDYIFYGPRERTLGELPSSLPVEPVFSNSEVTIFRVEP